MSGKLRPSLKNGKTFLACNFYNLETLQGVLQAAASKKKAIILQVTRSSIEYMGLQTLTNMARTMANAMAVEAYLHLDHATSIDLVEQCLKAGFDSVMIDASEKPFEQNIALTQRVVELAKPFGACVEAELGYVPKSGQSPSQHTFTEPGQARIFVEQTGVDLLAVAIGSAHGFYQHKPALDIKRLKEIHKITPAALVLHGSSGIPIKQLRLAITNGIQKINLATEIKNTFMHTLKAELAQSNEIDLRKVFPKARQAVTQLVSQKMEDLKI